MKHGQLYFLFHFYPLCYRGPKQQNAWPAHVVTWCFSHTTCDGATAFWQWQIIVPIFSPVCHEYPKQSDVLKDIAVQLTFPCAVTTMLGFHAMQDKQSCSRDRITKNQQLQPWVAWTIFLEKRRRYATRAVYSLLVASYTEVLITGTVSHRQPIKYSSPSFPRDMEPGKLLMSAGSCFLAHKCSVHSRHLYMDGSIPGHL